MPLLWRARAPTWEFCATQAHFWRGEFRLNHAASFAHEGTLGVGTRSAAVCADGREVGAGVGSGVGSGIGDHVGRAVGTLVGGAVVGRAVGTLVGTLVGMLVGGAAVGVDVPSSEPPPQAQHMSSEEKSSSL